MTSSKIVIESRVQLLSTLAEAAELEHNFMCLYLYAMLGLKRTEEEGLTLEEIKAVERWRRVILGVALEEMTHLALVANIFASLGSMPHFSRPNFPAFPGMYPADIIVELAKFDMSTLDHFIYLERPRAQELRDGESFVQGTYTREAPHGRLMPHLGDYETVGELYQTIREAITDLCEKLGEKNFFCGDPAQQIGPLDSPLPGLIAVKDKTTALQALDTIIRQGEGAIEEEGSHFARFQGIKKEYLQILKNNPKFDPSRPIARNPVMRKPLDTEHRVLVDEPLAAQYMDLANALYMFMLKCLTQVYAIENRTPREKKELLEISYTAMHAMGIIGETLTHMPASVKKPGVFAGMSFAMNRFMSPLTHKGELVIMGERLQQFEVVFDRLIADLKRRSEGNNAIQICLQQLLTAQNQVREIIKRADKLSGKEKMDSSPNSTSSQGASSLAAVAKSSQATPKDVSDSPLISISFETRKCMHARHCVTQLPGVFLANTPGKWIYPEKADAADLAAVIRQCPSGALQYKSHTEAVHDEPVPAVNIMRLRENDDTTLESRGGPLVIERMKDGPLNISGNLELCSGTGRVVLRTESVRLCRCGSSKSKPICDSSHVAAGFRDSLTAEEPRPPELS